jgi:hypothetical protein
MKRGARAPLFVFTFLHIGTKSFGFSLGSQLHTTTTTTQLKPIV